MAPLVPLPTPFGYSLPERLAIGVSERTSGPTPTLQLFNAWAQPTKGFASIDKDYPEGNPLFRVVVDYLSPSSIEAFELCERRWGWVKLNRQPKQTSEAADEGSAVHRAHDDWLTKGIPYDRTTRIGEIAACTLHLLPDPGSCVVEVEVRFTYAGIVFGGKIDVHWPEPDFVVILDHKTTGDFQWAKTTKEELIGHPQAPIYAAWGMAYYGKSWAHLRWNYALRAKQPKPKPSWHLVHESEVKPAIDAHIPTARRMLQVIEHANSERARGRMFGARDLPANPRACQAYGGCVHRKLCGIDTGDALSSVSL